MRANGDADLTIIDSLPWITLNVHPPSLLALWKIPMGPDRILTAADSRKLLLRLEARFQQHPQRHTHVSWNIVRERLIASPAKLWSLSRMEETGGEPDVADLGAATEKDIVFADCSIESPAGRRSLCYDPAALLSRKQAKPLSSAVGMAGEMGIELLDETQYRRLQTLGAFDLKTSSWVQTPPSLRQLGGALFCDRRYDVVFVYHNGAESYFASRGFRALLRV